jgi:hypothetical protein
MHPCLRPLRPGRPAAPRKPDIPAVCLQPGDRPSARVAREEREVESILGRPGISGAEKGGGE